MSSSSESTAAAPPRRGRWPRRLLLAILLLVGFLAACYFYARWSLGRETQSAIAETDRLDPGWRLEDVEADRKSYRDEDNSALHMIKLAKLIGGGAPGAHRDHAAVFDGLKPERQLNLQQMGLIRECFDKIPGAQAEARKLKDMPGGRFPISYSPDWISTIVKNELDAHRVFDLLQHDAILLAQQGDLDAALASCLALLNAARALGDEPMPIALVIRISGEMKMVDAAERCLAQGFPGDALMQELQGRLPGERADLQAHWLGALRGARAGHHKFCSVVVANRLPLSAVAQERGRRRTLFDRVRDELPMLHAREYAQHLRHMNEIVSAAQLPLEEQLDRFAALDETVDGGNVFTVLLASSLQNVAASHLRAQAGLAATEAALACERFRLSHKRWPENLAELVHEQLLERVPADPFDGRPLRFARLKDGVVIYCLGMDRKDNGGNIDRNRPRDDGVDQGVRLWDPQERRQAPPAPFER